MNHVRGKSSDCACTTIRTRIYGKVCLCRGNVVSGSGDVDMPVSDDVFKATIGLSSMSGGCGALC